MCIGASEDIALQSCEIYRRLYGGSGGGGGGGGRGSLLQQPQFCLYR